MGFFKIVSLLLLVSCATPGVKVRYDEFAGGYVTKLEQNILDTPGFGDIYFNVEAVKGKDSMKVVVIGVLDYEVKGDGTFHIDKTKELVLIVDGKRMLFTPIADSARYTKGMGVVATLHTHRMHYKSDLSKLKLIANAKNVKMKLYTASHKDGGFEGTFTAKNFKKLQEFIASLDNPDELLLKQNREEKELQSKKLKLKK